MSRSLLVTGGAGFIGSAFVRLACARGSRVTVLDALTYAGKRENLSGIAGDPELVVGNICNTGLVGELLKSRAIDSVVHFAAESHVDRSIAGPGEFIQTNVVGTYSMLEASRAYWGELDPSKKASFRYLQVSTDEVFGALGAQGKFNEVSPYAPNSPYSASKAAGDHLARAWFHTYGLPTLTTNCSNNYGPRQNPEKLIPMMITCAKAGKPLPVYGNGGNVRDWIHVDDHCHGVWLSLERGKPGATYCFGGDAERPNLELVELICREMDRQSPRKDGRPHESAIEFVTDRPGHDWRYAIDDSFASKELGFQRSHSLESGLAETIRWYLAG